MSCVDDDRLFRNVMGRLIGASDSEEDLVAAFLPFDKAVSGYVSVDDFRHAMTRLGNSKAASRTLPFAKHSLYHQAIRYQTVKWIACCRLRA